MMLKPFYQGKLDVFCALYAVLNGLRVTHNVRTLKAMEIFNDALMNFSLRPMLWHKILTQQTDYIEVVDELLARIKGKYPLEIECPYKAIEPASLDDLWQRCKQWLCPDHVNLPKRAIVFRFIKYSSVGSTRPLRHWTSACQMDENVMRLFDSSHDAEAILHLKKHQLRLYTDNVNVEVDPVIYIHSASLRFLRLPF